MQLKDIKIFLYTFSTLILIGIISFLLTYEKTGWVREGENLYYKNNNGEKLKSQWINSTYYLKEDGSLTTNDWAYDPSSNVYFYVSIDGKKDENKGKRYLTPETATNPWYVDGILIVNKKHPLPASYTPEENQEAATKFNELQKEMQKLGFYISNNYSGYRSYTYQKNLYNEYIRQMGQEEADRVSAKPGYSEHQSGLAFDLFSNVGGFFGTTKRDAPAVEWLKQNAHKYGFIIRYLEGKEHITGYDYEPWHLRYVGDKAEDIMKSGLTLEEYLGIEGGDYSQ